MSPRLQEAHAAAKAMSDSRARAWVSWALPASVGPGSPSEGGGDQGSDRMSPVTSAGALPAGEKGRQDRVSSRITSWRPAIWPHRHSPAWLAVGGGRWWPVGGCWGGRLEPSLTGGSTELACVP